MKGKTKVKKNPIKGGDFKIHSVYRLFHPSKCKARILVCLVQGCMEASFLSVHTSKENRSMLHAYTMLLDKADLSVKYFNKLYSHQQVMRVQIDRSSLLSLPNQILISC